MVLNNVRACVPQTLGALNMKRALDPFAGVTYIS